MANTPLGKPRSTLIGSKGGGRSLECVWVWALVPATSWRGCRGQSRLKVKLAFCKLPGHRTSHAHWNGQESQYDFILTSKSLAVNAMVFNRRPWLRSDHFGVGLRILFTEVSFKHINTDLRAKGWSSVDHTDILKYGFFVLQRLQILLPLLAKMQALTFELKLSALQEAVEGAVSSTNATVS